MTCDAGRYEVLEALASARGRIRSLLALPRLARGPRARLPASTAPPTRRSTSRARSRARARHHGGRRTRRIPHRSRPGDAGRDPSEGRRPERRPRWGRRLRDGRLRLHRPRPSRDLWAHPRDDRGCALHHLGAHLARRRRRAPCWGSAARSPGVPGQAHRPAARRRQPRPAHLPLHGGADRLVPAGDYGCDPALFISVDCPVTSLAGSAAVLARSGASVMLRPPSARRRSSPTSPCAASGSAATAVLVEVPARRRHPSVRRRRHLPPLLCGLVTDTGRFQYQNADPEAFACAARWSAGAAPARIALEVYKASASVPEARARSRAASAPSPAAGSPTPTPTRPTSCRWRDPRQCDGASTWSLSVMGSRSACS